MAPPIRTIGSDSGKSILARLILVIAVLAGVGLLSSSCMTRIDAGHVGVRVKLAGSSRGVDDIPTVTGWVFFNPLTEQIVVFPISVINIVWTKDPHEGKAIDESITFSSAEGAAINADIGLSFHIEPTKAPHLYLRFRKNDLHELANGYVRNTVREAFNVVASQMPVQKIYGSDKGRLEHEVRTRVQEKLGSDGFVLDQLTINGALRLPENVATAINRAMEQTQQAIQEENRVRQVRAQAEQAITQAEGAAKAARLRADGEAGARLITARAEAKANLMLRRSMSPLVMQYRALEKWNGRLPMMNGNGSLPMLTFDLSKGGNDDSEAAKMLREIEAEEAAEAAKDKDKAADASADAVKTDAAKPDAPKPDAPKTDAKPDAPKPPKK
jgi:regulator of protease activity HflC (stomatin/prohibitin superfamily)